MSKRKIKISIKKILTQDNMPLLAIKSTIGDKKGYFILDTGAQISALSNEIPEFYYKEIHNIDQVCGIVNEIRDVSLVEVGKVKLSRVKIRIGKCIKLDISHIQSKMKSKYIVFGLLGLSFFAKYDAIINLNENILILHATKK